MASFRDIKRRIGGVQSIQQITRAMKMVAAARLRRAEQAILALRPFSARLDKMCARFLQAAAGIDHPFFREQKGRGVAALAICSDRGLCGAYNNRVITATMNLLSEQSGRKQLVVAVGERGVRRLLGAGYDIHQAYEDIFNPVHFKKAQSIAQELQQLFLRQEVDEVWMVFTEFFNPLRQVLATRRLLPCQPELLQEEMQKHYDRAVPDGMQVEAEGEEEAGERLYIYEPDLATIGDRLLEHNISMQVYRALLEAQASEHGARMVAMDNATENAQEMIDDLTLLMNRVRQETITRELLDVVGGAEAMR